MKSYRNALLAVFFAAFSLVSAADEAVKAEASASASPTASQPPAIKNIVLVHGAFTDASSYGPVIERLQKRGFKVTAVQNPLTSLAADVQATEHALDRQDGPTLLVGHSWAGVPISQAGKHRNVAALAYLMAVAPKDKESAGEAMQRLGLAMAKADEHGEILLPPEAFKQVMGSDLSDGQNALLVAVQNPVRARALDDKIDRAAWQDKPSFYLLAEEDKALPLAAQQQFAAQIGAQTKSLKSGHLPMQSQPEAVADWLAEIATAGK